MSPAAAPLTPISPADLVALDDFTTTHPLKIDLVYAKPEHPDNMFKTKIYRPDARMLGHRELVSIILAAAQICFKKTGWIFEVKDCLRTFEAQALMRDTDIVKAHPQWLEEPGRLLSPPGAGGHPRGMAVDIILVDKNGTEIDMGTRFDFLTEDRNTLSRLTDRLRERGQVSVRVLLLSEGFTPGRIAAPAQDELRLPPSSTPS